MMRSVAEIPTASASKYLQQLCKHFAHKLPASFGPTEGRIDFPLGPVELTADETRLVVTVTAEDGDRLTELGDVVARHLVRFAFREDPAIDWRPLDV